MFNFWKKKQQGPIESQVSVNVTDDGASSGIRVVVNGEDMTENIDPGEWTTSKSGPSRTTKLLIETAKTEDSGFIEVDDSQKAQLIRDQITESLVAGEDIMRMTARITPLLDGDTERAESIARTASVHTYSASTMKLGRESGAKKKEWQAIILPPKKNGQKRKGSACDDCAALDGKTVKISVAFTAGGKSVQHPPLHEGCTCTIRLDYPYEP